MDNLFQVAPKSWMPSKSGRAFGGLTMADNRKVRAGREQATPQKTREGTEERPEVPYLPRHSSRLDRKRGATQNRPLPAKYTPRLATISNGRRKG
eukprot:scaffold13940_cov79-Isochrysis_galbana.AAC.1